MPAGLSLKGITSYLTVVLALTETDASRIELQSPLSPDKIVMDGERSEFVVPGARTPQRGGKSALARGGLGSG
jgi:hypothetical protein